jgi:hypothetical protein
VKKLLAENRELFFNNQPIIMKNLVFFPQTLRRALLQQQQSTSDFLKVVNNASQYDNPLLVLQGVRHDLEKTYSILQGILEEELLKSPF